MTGAGSAARRGAAPAARTPPRCSRSPGPRSSSASTRLPLSSFSSSTTCRSGSAAGPLRRRRSASGWTSRAASRASSRARRPRATRSRGPDPPARSGEQAGQRRPGGRVVHHLERGDDVLHLRDGEQAAEADDLDGDAARLQRPRGSAGTATRLRASTAMSEGCSRPLRAGRRWSQGAPSGAISRGCRSRVTSRAASRSASSSTVVQQRALDAAAAPAGRRPATAAARPWPPPAARPGCGRRRRGSARRCGSSWTAAASARHAASPSGKSRTKPRRLPALAPRQP